MPASNCKTVAVPDETQARSFPLTSEGEREADDYIEELRDQGIDPEVWTSYDSEFVGGNDPTYSIVRHRFEGENEVIRKGVTLEEAQEHCQREDTHGDGWFDGYAEES